MEELDRHIRDIPDFPSPGIMFKDITPMLQTPEAFQLAIDEIDRRFHETHYDHVVGIESRGFIFGAALAYKAKASLALVRKPGKLPYKTDAVSYDLEYGSDTVEIHQDSINAGDKVLIVDDVIATGGTVEATAKLVEKQGATVVGLAFVIELGFLKGRDRLGDYHIESLLRYD